MPFSSAELISIARAIRDIERGFARAQKKNPGVEVRIDSVPIHLNGTYVGTAERRDGALVFAPASASPEREPAAAPALDVVVIESVDDLLDAAEEPSSAEKPFGPLLDDLREDAPSR